MNLASFHVILRPAAERRRVGGKFHPLQQRSSYVRSEDAEIHGRCHSTWKLQGHYRYRVPGS